jgi:hypothetical protein
MALTVGKLETKSERVFRDPVYESIAKELKEYAEPQDYAIGFIGLRPLYDAGSYFTVSIHPRDSYVIRVHKADGEVVEQYVAKSSLARNARVKALIGAGLSLQA